MKILKQTIIQNQQLFYKTMATLAEIKTQLAIQNLKLTPINGNTDFLSYKDDEKGIIIIIHKNLAQQLQQNPQIDNLTFDTSTKFDESKNYTVYKIIENIPIHHDKEIKQPETAEAIKKAEDTHKRISLRSLSTKEITIASLVVGATVAVILGFVFCSYYTIEEGIKVNVPSHILDGGYWGKGGYAGYYCWDYDYTVSNLGHSYTRTQTRYMALYSKFNYILGIASFIISGGIAYLFLKKRNTLN